jgi:hypothetical protein
VILSQPPTGPPQTLLDVPPGFSLAVYGRLKTGGILTVAEVAGKDEDYTLQAAQLCYRHGSSRERCAKGVVWRVSVLRGQEQYLTLRIGGTVVARKTYRNIHIARPIPGTLAPPPVSTSQEAFRGPNILRVGESAYFASSLIVPATLCYRHGSSRVHCRRSSAGGFYVAVLSGRQQFFSLRMNGKVVARLVYRNVN